MFESSNPLLNGRKIRKAILAGAVTKMETAEQVEEYLDELAFLARTAGVKTIARFTQNVYKPNPRSFLGKGKLKEIAEVAEKKGAKLLIVDDELTGSQLNNVKQLTNLEVMDRSDLILHIFGLRAHTKQARIQVELARLQYIKPRLRHMWTHLERQRGGIGVRGGPGEQEIETDRRMIDKQIAKLKKQLKKIDKQSRNRMKKRDELIRVAMVGYTNAGKTTLMNLLSEETLFAENKLFATLDTTVRKVMLQKTPFLLSDTVGFIRKLPHHLVESFKTTLEEAKEADILLHVVDISQPNFEEHIAVVRKTLASLNANDSEMLLVFNKIDRFREKRRAEHDPFFDENDLHDFQQTWMAKMNGMEGVFVSALQEEYIDELRQKLLEMVKRRYRQRYPYKTEFYA